VNNQSTSELGLVTRGERIPEAEYQQFPRTPADAKAAVQTEMSGRWDSSEQAMTLPPVVTEIGIKAVETEAVVIPVAVNNAAEIEGAL